MKYIDHSDYKKALDTFKKGINKKKLNESVEEGNAFTKALAKTPKGGEFKVGSKSFKDKSGYDDPNVQESHEGNDEWYDDFQDGLYNLMTTDYITPLEYRHYQKALSHSDPIQDYSHISGHDAAKEFVDDLRPKEDMPGFGGTWDSLDSLSIKREGSDEVDNRLERIADLHKGKKIDFETVEKIAKALEAQGYEVNARYVQQFLSQHGVGIEEGLHMPPLQATGTTIDTVEEDITKLFKRRDTSKLDYDPDATRFEPDYMKTPGEDDDDDDNFDLEDDSFDITSSEELPKHFRKAVAGDKSRFPFLKENTGNAPFGFDVLSIDERKQLKQLIESIKTMKQEIVKLTSKAGKKVKAEVLGGNRTGLMMTPSVTSEGDSQEEIEKIKKIEQKIPEKVYQGSVLIIRQLRKAGLSDGEIMIFLQHEMEEKAQKAINAQHDY